MGVVIRQSFKATVISYIGAVLGYINLLFLYPLCLTPELIGFTRLIVEIATLLAWFSQLGISNAIVRFFPLFNNVQKRHNGFLFYITTLPFIGFIIFGIVIIVFKSAIIHYFNSDSNLIYTYFYYVLPIAFFIIYSSVTEAYSSVLMRIVVPRIAKEVVLRIVIMIVILLYHFKYIDQNKLIVGFTLAYGSATCVNLFYILKIQLSSFTPSSEVLTRKTSKSIVSYLLYILLTGLGGNVVSKIDIFMVSSKLNLRETGIFSLAFFMAMVIELPSRSLLQILSPITSKAIADNDNERLNQLYKKSSTNQMLLTTFVFVLLWINIDNVFKIMPNGYLYQSGVWVMFFIGLSKVFDAATGINIVIINNSKYYYFGLFVVFFLATNAIVLNYYLIPMYGITGAAITTASSILLSNILYVIFVWTKFRIHPFTLATLKTICLMLVVLTLNFYVLPCLNNPIFDLLVRGVVSGTILLFISYYWNISTDFNAVLLKIVKMRSLKQIQGL